MSQTCSFTNGASTRSSEELGLKCKASKSGHGAVLIGCDYCRPGDTIWRCAGCYDGFRTQIKARIIKASRAKSHVGLRPWVHPSVQLVCDTDWKTIERGGRVPRSSGLDVISEKRLKWREPCASCYQKKFAEEIDARMPPGFAAEAAQVENDGVYDLPQTPVMSDEDGSTVLRNVELQVLTATDVITDEEAGGCKFRFAVITWRQKRGGYRESGWCHGG